MVAAKKPAAKKTRPAALSGDALTVNEVQDAPAAFARGGLDDSHPLATAFHQSIEDNVAKRLSVSDPELAEKLIRKYAAAHDLGVRIIRDADTITIKGGQKKAFSNRGGNKGSEFGSHASGEGAPVVPNTEPVVPPSAEDFLGGEEER